MNRTFDLSPLEAERLNELLAAFSKAERDLKVAFTMVTANRGVATAEFKMVTGLKLVVEVPESNGTA